MIQAQRVSDFMGRYPDEIKGRATQAIADLPLFGCIKLNITRNPTSVYIGRKVGLGQCSAAAIDRPGSKVKRIVQTRPSCLNKSDTGYVRPRFQRCLNRRFKSTLAYPIG